MLFRIADFHFHNGIFYIELGDISKESIIDGFEKTPWADFLMRMKNIKEEDIHYLLSLEIENKDIGHGLSISAVGEPANFEFYKES